MMPIVAGIDEAGRGSVVGPMVIAGVACKLGTIKKAFPNRKIDDSKKISKFNRSVTAKAAREKNKFKIVRTSVLPRAIDNNNLNKLTAEVVEKVIPNLPADKYFIDEMPALKRKENRIIEESADEKYKITGLASIIAKAARDHAMDQISSIHGMQLGSGYPSDKTTFDKLGELVRKDSNHVRYSWSTINKVW